MQVWTSSRQISSNQQCKCQLRILLIILIFSSKHTLHPGIGIEENVCDRCWPVRHHASTRFFCNRVEMEQKDGEMFFKPPPYPENRFITVCSWNIYARAITVMMCLCKVSNPDSRQRVECLLAYGWLGQELETLTRHVANEGIHWWGYFSLCFHCCNSFPEIIAKSFRYRWKLFDIRIKSFKNYCKLLLRRS